MPTGHALHAREGELDPWSKVLSHPLPAGDLQRKSAERGTLVEQTTRFTLLLHLPPMSGHGTEPHQKNGPALAGHGAKAVRGAIAKSIQDLPEHLRKSLTWDQGAEMAQHEKLKSDTGINIYFCDLQSPLSAMKSPAGQRVAARSH